MNEADQNGQFDAYSATVYANAEALFDDLFCLMESAGLDPKAQDGLKARFYATNRQLIDEKGHQLLALKSGGSNPHPHVECTGRASPVLAEYLREHYEHKPTRIDHAMDIRDFGLFDKIAQFARGFARSNRLKLSFAGDWANQYEGRTVYIGSRTSQVFVRVYEKGIKTAKENGLPLTADLRDLVRIELEFKPQTKAAKALAPTITGPEMWGSTDWTRQFADRVLGMGAKRVSIRDQRVSNDERSRRLMAQQYARILRGWFEDCDSDFCEFGHAIGVLAGFPEAQE
ncbi:replication initiation factor domain-containing protein [Erythrobacter ani]|uniref:Replication initiation factor domain-containing protein n=1 Tax=Erythrobacter ani TaxID=2827235 RepID=A0ABS6SRB2_9SPHN|nr:replication initiation factor domain-containing protein [Erythrobacter ani]MBV7267558.1 replication initiation factor domain-containing protein [Erythrobacter ani]